MLDQIQIRFVENGTIVSLEYIEKNKDETNAYITKEFYFKTLKQALSSIKKDLVMQGKSSKGE